MGTSFQIGTILNYRLVVAVKDAKYLSDDIIYRVRHIFWPDIKWQFSQSVHVIFKKKKILVNKPLEVGNVYVIWFFKSTILIFRYSFMSFKNERVIYRINISQLS